MCQVVNPTATGKHMQYIRIIERKSRSAFKETVKLIITNGASISLASLRAISVFPQPVGPTMRMFLGTISSFMGLSIRCRRHLLRSALATAFFASVWPTMLRSRISTTSRGVSAARGSSSSVITGTKVSPDGVATTESVTSLSTASAIPRRMPAPPRMSCTADHCTCWPAVHVAAAVQAARGDATCSRLRALRADTAAPANMLRKATTGLDRRPVKL
mmetsp:Transcript_12717/g.38344  ORF Transcript_12717/g.38344 Transcript_12717/m.38344 type:complete len:217 (-) Transcript_12717:198-848(-)